jgi:uncharacterized RDD family membrane protein YckC
MQRPYANVFTRLAAIVLDGLILIPFYVPIFIFARLDSRPHLAQNMDILYTWLIVLCFVGIFAFAIWNTIVRMGKTGQSLGRKFLNIAVLDSQGRPIGFGRFISGIVCYIGYLNAFWDSKRQMWHDKMADSFVYNVEENFS